MTDRGVASAVPEKPAAIEAGFPRGQADGERGIVRHDHTAEDAAPLSYAQQRLWLLDQIDPRQANRIDVEWMALTHYRLESDSAFEGDFASKGAYVRTTKFGIRGVARATFRLALGIYDAFVAYFDETDGTSRFDVCIDGQRVDAWVAYQHRRRRLPGRRALD